MTNPPGKALIKSVGESDADAKIKAELEAEKARFAALAQRKQDIEVNTRRDRASEHQGEGNPLRTGRGKQEVEEMTARRGLVIVHRDPFYTTSHPETYERHQQIEGGVVERQIPIRGSAEGAVITEDYYTAPKQLLKGTDFTNGGPGCFAIFVLPAPTNGKLTRLKLGTLVAVTAGIKVAIGISQRTIDNTAPGFAAWSTTYEPWVYSSHESFTPDIPVGGAAKLALDRVFESPVPYQNQDDHIYGVGFAAQATHPNQQVCIVIAFNCLRDALPVVNFLEIMTWAQEVV